MAEHPRRVWGAGWRAGVPVLLATIISLAGWTSILAWWLDAPDRLPSLHGSDPMAPDTGLAFVLASFCVFLMSRGRAPRFLGLAGIIFAGGGVLLLPFSSTQVPGMVGRFCFRLIGIEVQGAFPHMAFATGLAFALFGCGLILLYAETRWSVGTRALLTALCGMIMSSIGAVCLLDFWLGVPWRGEESWDKWMFQMSVETAALLLLLGLWLCRAAWQTSRRSDRNKSSKAAVVAGLLVTVGLALLFVAVNFTLGLGLGDSLRYRALIAQALVKIQLLGDMMSAVRTAESGQRGYLLTGDDRYLIAYHSGAARVSADLKAERPETYDRALLFALNRLIDQKMAELEQTIRLAKSGHKQEALNLVTSDIGRKLMEEIEEKAAAAIKPASHFIAARDLAYQRAIEMVRRTIIASYGLAISLVLCAAFLFWKEMERRAEVVLQLRQKETELEASIEARTAELKRSERRYRAMLDQSPVAIHILDQSGNSMDVNAAFERLVGLPAPQMKGYNIWDDPQPISQGTRDLLERAFAGNVTSMGPVYHVPSASVGTTLGAGRAMPSWIEVIAYPVKSDDGAVQEVVLLCHDVTDRELAIRSVRESEIHFRTLTSTLPQIVWTAKPQGEIEFYNDRWYEVTGCDRAGDKSWTPVVHPDDLPHSLEQWSAAMILQEAYEFELRMWDKTKEEYRWFLARCVPVRDRLGEVTRWVGTSTDIHDKVIAEEILEKKVQARTAELQCSYALVQAREDELRRSLHERDTLFREVHHRVKNNLQVISSLLRMQAGSLKNQPVAAEALEESRRRVMSMAMIHERLYSNKQMDRIDFADYTEKLVKELLYSFAMPDRRVQSQLDLQVVHLKVDQAIPCGLILNEVVTNALKYAFAGQESGTVSVTLGRTGNGDFALNIRDNGVGLPEGFNWRKSKSMGLPIVEILAKQLEGTVTVESGEGVAVTLLFPLPIEAEQAA